MYADKLVDAYSALDELVADIPQRDSISAIAVAGTTTTSVLVDRISGNNLAEPILYNQTQDADIVEAAAVSTQKHTYT